MAFLIRALALALICSVLTTAESQTQGEGRILQSADETLAQGNDRASRRLMRQEARDAEVPASLFGTSSSDSEEEDDEERENAAAGEDGFPGGTYFAKEVDNGKISGGSFVVTEGGESQCPSTARIATSDECKAAAKELKRKFFQYSTPYAKLPSGCSQVRGMKGMVYFNGGSSQSTVARGFVRLICMEKPQSLVTSTTTTAATTSTTKRPTTTTATVAVHLSASSSKDNVTSNMTNMTNWSNGTVTIKSPGFFAGLAIILVLTCWCWCPCVSCLCTCCCIFALVKMNSQGKSGKGAEGMGEGEEEQGAEGEWGPVVGSYVLVVSLGRYGTVYSGPDENQLYTVTFEDDGTLSGPLLASDLQAVNAEGAGAEGEPAQEEAAAPEEGAPAQGVPVPA